MSREEQVEALAGVLIGEGAGAGSSLHSWRCDYPDRYGPCDCVAETAKAILDSPAFRTILADERAAALREAARDGSLHFAATHTGRDARGWDVVEADWLRARADEVTR